jgi:inosine/xanthosine triphosphatase
MVIMIIAVGSRNNIKVAAIRAALDRLYADVVIQDVDVDSGVPAQPWGENEIMEGAINRAQHALEATDAELGVGLEAGVIRNNYGYFTNAWCAVCNRRGELSLGGGFNVELPPVVIRALEAGLDLGQALDKVPSVHHHSVVGAIGVLTNNILDRRSAYEAIVLCAMAHYLRSDLYTVIEHE